MGLQNSQINNIQLIWFKLEKNPQEKSKSRTCQAAVGYKFQMYVNGNKCRLFPRIIFLTADFAWANSLQKLYSSGRRVAEVVTLPHLDKRGRDGPQTKKRKMKKNRENGAK